MNLERGRALLVGCLTLGLLATLVSISSLPARLGASRGDAPTSRDIARSFANLPLVFEPNQGQIPKTATFAAHGPSLGVRLSPTDAEVLLGGHAQRPDLAMNMVFEAGNRDAAPMSLQPLMGTVNYFPSSDPAQWRTNIPTYEKVGFKDVYPGIDVLYYGNHNQLEYDVVVQPGADPSLVVLGFRGADSLSLDEASGDLIARAGASEVRLRRPMIYQESDGLREAVSGGYRIQDADRVAFQLSTYDTSRPLVIDPVLGYATYLGGASAESGMGIAVDSTGYAYIAGWTLSTGFPTTPGVFQPAYNGSHGGTAFVTKLAPDGASLVYSTYLGQGVFNSANGISVDADGNAYIAGETHSADFPITPNAYQRAYGGGTANAFVTKLNWSGTALLYSTFLGGSDFDHAHQVAVDAQGYAYVVGETSSMDFPTRNAAQARLGNGHVHTGQAGHVHSHNATGASADTADVEGTENAFVARLTPDGSDVVFSTYLGGSQQDHAHSIAIDPQGNAWVGGHATSPDYPTTSNAFQRNNAGASDGLIARFSPNGTLLYSSLFGGTGYDEINGIAVGPSGSVYVTGRSGSTDLKMTSDAIRTEPFKTADAVSEDMFVARFNSAASQLVYSTHLGGSYGDRANAIAVDVNGNAFVVGETKSTDFPMTRDSIQTTWGGGAMGAVLAELGPDGALLYATFLGGNRNDRATSVAVDSVGNVYVTGFTNSTNLPTTYGVITPNLVSDYDAFTVKVRFSDAALPRPTPAPKPVPAAASQSAPRADCPDGATSMIRDDFRGKKFSQTVPPQGAAFRVTLPGNLRGEVSVDRLPYVPTNWDVVLEYDPTPFIWDDVASDLMSDRSLMPVGRPVDLSFKLKDSLSGTTAPLPDSLARTRVMVTLPVVCRPERSTQQFVWLSEVQSDGGHLGFARLMGGEYDSRSEGTRYSVSMGEMQGTLFTPALVTLSDLELLDPTAHLWAGPMGSGADLGPAGSKGTILKSAGPKAAGRRLVLTPGDRYAWIEVTAVAAPGSSAATAAASAAALTALATPAPVPESPPENAEADAAVSPP